MTVIEPGRVLTRDGTVGYGFTVERPTTVSALGKFDANGNGLLDDAVAPQVGLWHAGTGELLASTLVDDESELENSVFYAPISPIELAPGDYVIGVESFRDQEPV
ncbi:MAG: hypothetical protein ACC645_17845, partial [Pirellulales bacterium]